MSQTPDGPPIDPSREYTAREAAALFKVDAAQLYRWADKKKLAVVSRRPLRVLGSAIQAHLKRRSVVRPHGGVIAVPYSGNAKLGRAAATIVARQSCPSSCPFMREGCYAEHDNTRVHWDRITAGSAGKTPLELARAEAAAIDALPGDRDLRLHAAGDSVTEEGTRLIAAACERYVLRGRAKYGREVRVWGYTHGFLRVTREAWGRVSVLASCETPRQVAAAHARGYAAAIVVPEFEGEAAYTVGADGNGEGGVKVIPCPQQTRGKTCTDCQLCLNAERLHERRLAIGFALHGWGINKARRALTRVALPVFVDGLPAAREAA